MTFKNAWRRSVMERLRPHERLHPLARRARLLVLTQLLVVSVVQLAPAQGQFKYRIDRSGGDKAIESSQDQSRELWFGRPREESTRADSLRPSETRTVPEGGGAVLDIPWKKRQPNAVRQTPQDMLELLPDQIIVESARIRLEKNGGYVIDVQARVVGPAPAEFVTVAGLTETGHGFAAGGHNAPVAFMAWKKIERGDSRQFLMSFALPKHYTMRRYDHYLVKFYDAAGFAESQLPRD